MFGAGWQGRALFAQARVLACGRDGRWSAAPAAQSLAGRRVPVEELDDDAIGVGDLERALAPGLLAQRHGDLYALPTQAGQLTLEVLDDERQDQARGTGVALVVGQQGQATAQEGDVHPGVLASQGGEAVCSHILPEAEVAGQECSGGGDVGDVEGYGGSGDLHRRASSGRAIGSNQHCTQYSVLRTTQVYERMF